MGESDNEQYNPPQISKDKPRNPGIVSQLGMAFSALSFPEDRGDQVVVSLQKKEDGTPHFVVGEPQGDQSATLTAHSNEIPVINEFLATQHKAKSASPEPPAPEPSK